MAIAVVQALKFAGTTGFSQACLLGSTTTGNTLVLITVPYTSAGTDTVSSITSSAGTATFAQLGRQAAVAPTYGPIEIQVAPNIVGATTPTLTVNFTFSTSTVDIYVYELSGVPSTTTQDGGSGAAQTTATACVTPNITTTNAGSIVFGAFSPAHSMTAAGSGWTGLLGTANGTLAEYQIETTTQTNLQATGTQNTTGVYGAYVFALKPAGVTQAITPTGIASVNAFGTAAVGRGTVNIAPTGIASVNAFGTAVIAPGAVSVTPTGIASTNAFGTAAVGRGAVNIAPAGIASTNVFGTATIAVGAPNIAPAGIASTNTFGVAVIAPGAVNIAPAGIASTNAFGAPTLAQFLNIAPIGISSTTVFGTAAVVRDPPPPITVPSYSGQTQPSPMPVNPDIAWRESQPEEGPWVMPPYAEIFPGGEQGVGTAVVPPPISKTDLWAAMQTWPM